MFSLLAVLAGLQYPVAAKDAVFDLPRLEQLALEHSPIIKQAHANRDAAKAREMQVDSDFWPQLTAGAGIGNSKSYNASSEEAGSAYQAQDAYLNLSQTLFDYSLWFRSKSAGLNRMAHDESVRAVINDVLDQVRQAYFAVQIAEQLLEVALRAHTDTEAFRDRVRILMDSGLVPQLDLARAEYDLAEAARKVIEARASWRKQCARLALVVGLDDIYYASLGNEARARAEAFNLNENELVGLAVKFRPEIKQMDYLAQAALEAVEEAKGGYFPVLSFQGTIGRAGRYGFDHSIHSYGLYLDVPVFQGFRTRGQVLEYQAFYRIALQQLAQARLVAREETHVAYQGLQEIMAKVEVSQNQIITAEENWRLMESRYQAGLATPLELSEARTNRFSAQAQLVSDQIMVLSSLATLDRVVGGALFPFVHQRTRSGVEK